MIEEQAKILEGNNSEAGDTTEGGFSNGAEGLEDSAFDWGSGTVEVFEDIAFIAFL